MSRARLYVGNALDVLPTLPTESVQCCVTSPPYFGLRDYGVEGQLGLEPTPQLYVEDMVTAFQEVWRVLQADGTLWLNMGDSYAGGGNGARDPERWPKQSRNANGFRSTHAKKHSGLKPKDPCMIPARVALTLQADGWWLRSDIIWSKPNPMPESVTDRPTKSHEYVFLLTKTERYFYDADAIAEPDKGTDHPRSVLSKPEPSGGLLPEHSGIRKAAGRNGAGRNARTVWEIATKPYPEAHFATFPPELASRCIKAGSRPGDVVLDPFGGSGTTAATATGLGRDAIHIDLNPEYLELARNRIGPLLCDLGEPIA